MIKGFFYRNVLLILAVLGVGLFSVFDPAGVASVQAGKASILRVLQDVTGTPTSTPTPTASMTTTATVNGQTGTPTPTGTLTPTTTTTTNGQTTTPTATLTVTATGQAAAPTVTVTPTVAPGGQTTTPTLAPTETTLVTEQIVQTVPVTATQVITVTATFAPFPTLTLIYPQKSDTPALLSDLRLPGNPALSKPEAGRVDWLRLGACGVILLLWVALAIWLAFSQRRVE